MYGITESEPVKHHSFSFSFSFSSGTRKTVMWCALSLTAGSPLLPKHQPRWWWWRWCRKREGRNKDISVFISSYIRTHYKTVKLHKLKISSPFPSFGINLRISVSWTPSRLNDNLGLEEHTGKKKTKKGRPSLVFFSIFSFFLGELLTGRHLEAPPSRQFSTWLTLVDPS